MKARQNCLASLCFFRFQAARTICLNSFNPNLELFNPNLEPRVL